MNISIEDLVNDPSDGFLKVRLFVYLNTIHRHSEHSLEEIIEKACEVFKSDVTSYVEEWRETLTNRQQKSPSFLTGFY